MVLPLLLRAATSSIVKSTAKNAVKSTVKSKAKDFIRGKSKKKSSAIVKDGVSKTEVRPVSSALVPIKKIDEKPDIVDAPTKAKVSKTESRTDNIEKQLNNIVNLTSTLNSLVLSQYNQKKKTEEKRRKKLEKEKKRRREEEQETEEPGSNIIGGAVSKAKQFNIFDALLNFFLGAGLLRLITFLRGNVDENGKPKGLFKSLSEALGNVRNLFYGFRLAKAALGSLVSAIGRGFKAIPNLFKSVVGVATKVVKGIGGSLVKGFKGLLGSKGKIFTFFKGIVNNAKNLASAAARLSGIDTRSDDIKNAKKRLEELERLRKLDAQISKTFSKPGVSETGDLGRTLGDNKSGYRSPDRYRAPGQARAGGFQLEQARKARMMADRVQPTVPKAGNLAGGIRGSSLTSRGLRNAPGRLATRVIGRGGRESLRGISKVVGGGLKFGGKVVGRIPIIGPLIVLVSNLLDPEVNANRALFRAGGAALGGGIGAALVGGATVGFGAILGGIVGEVLGEYLGDLLYIVFKGGDEGGIKAVGEKIQQDISNALTEGAKYVGMIKDWAKKGFGRLYEGLPKLSLPKWLPFVGGKEILEPNLAKIIISAVTNIPKAFFSDDSIKPGEVTKKGGAKKDESKKPKVGTKAILGGKPVIWAGDNWGWQSPESYNKIKGQGSVTPSGPTSSGSSPQGSVTPPDNPSQKQAFDYIYNLAKKVGGTKWPEIVAAQAMHETGYLVNPNSVYFSTNKTNPFGQTGDRGYGTIPRAGDPAGWTLYPNLETAVKDHIKLWHDVNNHPQNYNAFDNILDGIAAVAKAYSPDADPANIRLGYTVDKYSKGMVRALKVGGFDPNTTRTGPVPVTPPAKVQPTGPTGSTGTQGSVSTSGASTSGPTNLLNMFASAGSTQAQQIQSQLAQLTPQQTNTNQGSLTSIVPIENLQSIGAGTGPVGMTSGRGMRWGKMHRGVDIGTDHEKGWYVAFTLKGVVSDVGTFAGYGKTVVITAGDKDFLFAHLANILVKKGENYTGQIIGEIGNTGSGTSEHLHFEVSPAGTGGYQQDEDPMPYVKYLKIGKFDPNGQKPTPRQTTPSTQVSPGGTSPTQVSPRQTTPSSPAPAQVTPRGTSQNTQVLEQYAEYENGGEENIVAPIPIGGGGGSPVIIGGGGSQVPLMAPGMSPETMVNNWWRVQLLGFLYKQG